MERPLKEAATTAYISLKFKFPFSVGGRKGGREGRAEEREGESKRAKEGVNKSESERERGRE